ncbi:porin family protein [Spirosoma knui]
MKRYYSFLILSLLPISLAVAQSTTTKPGTSSRSAVKPPATRPAATDASSADQSGSSAQSTSSNRRQELYDQYHSQTKRPAAQTPTSSPAPASQPTAETETPKPVMAQTSNRTQSSAAASPKDDGSSSGVRIGIRGGVTYLAYTEENSFAKPAVGFVGGVTFNFGKGALSFQPEINYARYSSKITVLGFSSTIAADQIEVPLFLKISSGTYEGNRFFLNVGPYGSYLASARADGQKESLEGTSGRFGFGAAAGVGAAILAGPGHFTVEVRGHYPLGDIDNGFATDANIIFCQAAVGYVFPLGGR